VQERIFEPFEQLEPIRHKHTPGVGLGLALVREMLSALGGSIRVDSRVDQGSTFTVVLPGR
jgi:signal transduction histidine kinase